MTTPRIEPLGDSALLVTLGASIDPLVNDEVHRLAGAVRRLSASDPRFGSPTPAYASLLVPFDPLEIPFGEASATIAGLAESSPVVAPAEPRGLIEIPVRYGSTDGPDLERVASLAGLSPEAVIEIHAGTAYRCYMLGFTPGFAYLGPLDLRIATPRLATPRGRVAAGSVGIAGQQTGIYPVDSPGGWQLIGRTDVRTWDPSRDPPALIRPASSVRFIPVR